MTRPGPPQNFTRDAAHPVRSWLRAPRLFRLLLAVLFGLGPTRSSADVPPVPPVTARVQPAPAGARVAEATLKPGETLERVLVRQGIHRRDAAAIASALRSELDLRRLRPGGRVTVTRGPDGAILSVRYSVSALSHYDVRPTGGHWEARAVTTPAERRLRAMTGVIGTSLFGSLERLGVGASLAARFVGLFEWDFDFLADAQPGDRFRFLVQEQLVDGRFIGYGEILVAQYESAGRPRLTAIAFEVEPGRPRYFDVEGRALHKMFLRAPLDFTRITSGFSHARVHPILGGTHPHLAIDYAAPTGTPVRAVADGVVAAAGWNGDSGLSVTVQHVRGYTTMYNHLSQIDVRPGQRVAQRQVVGRVGATGLATGPHLDYRVARYGRFLNPLAERFAGADPLPQSARAAFLTRRDEVLATLDRLTSLTPLPTGPANGEPPARRAHRP